MECKNYIPLDELNKTYKIDYHSLVGSGSFGTVYRGINTITNEIVAIKIEQFDKIKSFPSQWQNEYSILSALNHPGIPKPWLSSKAVGFNYLILPLFSSNIEHIFEQNHFQFSLKTSIIIAMQLLDIVEYLHLNKYIHRDIKPDNIVVDASKTRNQILLIDYGLSKRYVEKESNEHIKKTTNNKLCGSLIYSSVYCNYGFENSRRDDLESIGYVIAYWVNGKWPWQGWHCKTKEEKFIKVRKLKIKHRPEDLFSMRPREFVEYWAYVRNLKFSDDPDYGYWKGLMTQIFNRYEYKDMVFDWKWEH